ncbi:MAG: hypothetical protein AAF441_28110 [Pseudomonadota bacterium]
MLDLLKKHFACDKPRIFQGSLGVVPRGALQRLAEDVALVDSYDLEESFRAEFASLVDVPPVQDRQDSRPADMSMPWRIFAAQLLRPVSLLGPAPIFDKRN